MVTIFIKLMFHCRMSTKVFRLEWASLFDTEKLLGKQVMVLMVLVLVLMGKLVLNMLTKVSWEALREALAVLERPSTVEEITDATWKVI